MGRPPDQFCWDNVDKLPTGRWRCKHCQEEFSGAASRIRIHLSGEGTDLRSCKAVPSHVREKASKRASKKRGRNSSSGEGNDGISAANRSEVVSASANNSFDMATTFQVPSSNGDLSTHTNKCSEQEYTTDVLVKFFMSRNLPVDVVKDPHFRTFLTRVAQHGFPSCLLRNDFVGIQKSVSNLEYEVNEYMLMVKESWKTTGCTLIQYKLNEGRGNPSALATDNVVYGFYCLEGFIFVEGRQLDFSQGFENAFKNHVLNLPMEEVIREIYHSGPSGCEFVVQEGETLHGVTYTCCVGGEVEQLWMGICRETEWVHDLIQKSEKVYQCILNSHELMVGKDPDATLRSSFTRLTSIMQLEDRIKAWLSDYPSVELGVEEIIDNNEFWSDGKELVEALTPFMGIIDVMDTLVPTLGYLRGVVDKAKLTLKPYYEREVSKYRKIWQSLDDLIAYPDFAAYFNPIYDWGAIPGSLDLDEIIQEAAVWSMNGEYEKEEKLLAEWQVYIDNNPFANLSVSQRECNHPVILWNKYGGDFPLLRKYAIRAMGQPTSCMCKQVKKHITHFHGEDNFILRLNYHMMQQFTKLGDSIYQPLERRFWCRPEMVNGPHIGQIPEWMNEFISKSTDVIADGNCGYRAIAESLGLGQDKWYEVKQKLYDELTSQPQLYACTFVHGNVCAILKALEYNGTGFAPPETWLEVTDMGLLVASTFKAMFVVMGPTICCTYLPLYLPEGCQFSYVPEIVVCLISKSSHFTSLSLTKNAPLPHVPDMWLHYHLPSTEGFDRFLIDRLTSYKMAAARYNIISPCTTPVYISGDGHQTLRRLKVLQATNILELIAQIRPKLGSSWDCIEATDIGNVRHLSNFRRRT